MSLGTAYQSYNDSDTLRAKEVTGAHMCGNKKETQNRTKTVIVLKR